MTMTRYTIHLNNPLHPTFHPKYEINCDLYTEKGMYIIVKENNSLYRIPVYNIAAIEDNEHVTAVEKFDNMFK